MTARAFLPYLRQDCKFLFIHNIFKICNLQVLLRNVARVEEGGRKFGILLLLLFPVELSPSFPALLDAPAWLQQVLWLCCWLHLWFVVCQHSGRCTFWGVLLEMKSALEIPSPLQDLTDNIIDSAVYSSLESSTQKNIHANKFLSALPISPGHIRTLMQRVPT